MTEQTNWRPPEAAIFVDRHGIYGVFTPLGVQVPKVIIQKALDDAPEYSENVYRQLCEAAIYKENNQ